VTLRAIFPNPDGRAAAGHVRARDDHRRRAAECDSRAAAGVSRNEKGDPIAYIVDAGGMPGCVR
jgi:hypothetical protein